MIASGLIVFTADLPWSEIGARAFMTALVVLLVALIVGKLGPMIGGLMAGLPMGFAPGFYFLIKTQSTPALHAAGSHALLALCATQAFLLSYMLTCRFSAPMASLCYSIGIWLLAIYALNMLSLGLPATFALFTMTTFATRKLGKGLRQNDVVTDRSESYVLLIARACFGGILVAVVTVCAPKLGGELSGILLAFPIGFALICLTTHEQYGPATLIDFAYSALRGATSLAMFCLGFTAALSAVSGYRALAIGLIAALVSTGVLMLIAASEKKSLSLRRSA
ncbi:hypothetical protein [Pacificibacter sp. AS14]|uniref:hypothetical protein n=1 Tax=Pacificibacter sp. AS14 TaxID=3135785 RepID=UPI00317D624F